MAKEMAREIGNKSREFYEFVLPPVDMHQDDSKLTVIIDMPGFKKEEIKVSISENILSIKAKKSKDEESESKIISKQRPDIIDKKIRLPIYVKEGEETVTSAKYSDGVLTLIFPVTKKGKDISID